MRPWLALVALAVLGAAFAGCKSAQRPGPGGGRFGLVKELAVEVCYPPGEQEFLHRLRCPGGGPARQVERGSVGTRTPARNPDDPRLLEQLDAGRRLRVGEPDFHLVDRFLLSCPDGDWTVYIDMYHCNQPPPSQAPDGMELAGP